MRVVFLYASLLALLFVALSVRTLLLRRRLRIGIGDGGDPRMLGAMRAHANFAEYVPLGLLLLFFAEAAGTTGPLVHALGASVLAGRVSHAFGVSRIDEQYAFRVVGMALTLGPIVVAAGLLAAHVAQRAP